MSDQRRQVSSDRRDARPRPPVTRARIDPPGAVSAIAARQLPYDPSWDRVEEREFVWEPWTTIAGVTTGSTAFLKFGQAEANYLDLDDIKTVELRADIYGWSTLTGITLTGATMTIETASSQEGPWLDILTFTAASVMSVVISSEGVTDYPALRYLRYTLASATLPWKVTFRLTATPQGKGPMTAGYPPDSAEGHTGYLQPWMAMQSLSTASSTAPIVQDYDDWWKTDGLQYLTLESEVTMLSAATLVLECAYNREGPWQTVVAYTTAYTVARVTLAATAGSTLPAIARLMRWRLEGTPSGASPWIACFRVSGRGTK